MVKAEMQPMEGQTGAWPIKGGVVIGSDIGWSMGGSEGGVANQGCVVIGSDVGAWSKQRCNQ